MHDKLLIKGFYIPLARDLCGKAFHFEAEEGGRDKVDGFADGFRELIHGFFLGGELGEDLAFEFVEWGSRSL